MKYLDKNFDLNIFSRFRKELMGAATIFIILVHTVPYNVLMPTAVKAILGNAGLGVDIFLFLSGLGMYNSYNNSKKNKITFVYWFYKRLIRIVVPLALIAVPILIWNPWEYDLDIIDYIAEISGFGNLFGFGQLWFLPCILLLYLITPLFDVVVKAQYKNTYTILCIIAILTACYVANSNSVWIFLLQRWPSYIIGYLFAQDIRDHGKGSIWYWMIIPLAVYIVLYVLNHKLGTRFSLFWLQGIPIMTLIGIALDKLSCTCINRILAFLGVLSLESYITNDYVLRTLQTFNWTIGGYYLNYGNYLLYIGGTVLCVVLSYYVNKFSKIIVNLIA